MARIAGIQSENVKVLKLVEYTFDKEGELLLISGENDQGKSTFLELFKMLLGGGEYIPEVPINKEAENAYIQGEIIDIDGYDDLLITRTFTKKDSYVRITNKEGTATYNTPQAILNKLTNKHALDPLAFITDKDQVGTLLKLGKFKINPRDIDVKIKLHFDDRTYHNREHKKYKGLLEDMSEPEMDLPDEPISISKLNEEKNEMLRYNKLNEDKRKGLADQKIVLEDAQTALVHILGKEEELKESLNSLREQRHSTSSNIKHIEKTIESKAKIVFEIEDGNTETIDDAIYKAEETNKKIESRTAYQRIEGYRDDAYEKADKETSAIDLLKKQKENEIRNGQLPVVGLSYDENGIVYQGLPFNQASDSDQLKVSFNIATALNPGLKLIISKEGDKLGIKKIKELTKLAKDGKYLFLIERRNDDGLPAIVFEDGMIKK